MPVLAVRLGFCCAVLSALCARAPAAEAAPPMAVEEAVAQAVRFLGSQIGQDGRVAGEFPETHPQRLFGGKTALTVYALLAAGEDPKRSPALERAVRWLAAAKLDGVYPVALRACALAAVKGDDYRDRLARDVRWLVEAADSDGAYTYTHQGGRRRETYDNSSSQVAVAGVWAGVSRGVIVPKAYWTKVRQHWLDQQQVDGGWGYRIKPRALRTRSYGSMTAAGLATLYACFDVLQADDFARPSAARDNEPIARAIGWLAANFRADENPAHGVEWYYDWLWCVQRVGQASGYKYLGSEDWFARGTEELLRRRNGDGSWGVGEATDRLPQTAFALLFLGSGRRPVAFNKLQYDGQWNSRPRDLANLTGWLAQTFERPVTWQVVGLNASLEDWLDAPVVYLSGAGACELSDDQLAKLRQYVLQGGTILSEAAGNNGAFTLDIQKIHQKLFPAWPARRLDPKHPIYSMQFPAAERTELIAVSNGIRLLAVHSPRELSLAMQSGPRKSNLPTFELLANIELFVTDGGALLPRGEGHWPQAGDFAPKTVIRVARLEHAGNCDPEPLAWHRLALLAGRRRGIRLVVSDLMPAAKLDAKSWPLAAMTGTEAFKLPEAEAAALGRYLADGGVLIVDAAGGSAEFAKSVREQIAPLVSGGKDEPLEPGHPIYKGVVDGRRVLYRRDFAQTLGPNARTGRLRAVHDDKHLAVVFSDDDLTAGLVGYPCYKLRGYTPETAVDLMLSILAHATAPAGETK